ncbi:MAG: DEAD/DEAH box helicase [Thermoanaerobaculaceae bacterium]|jgi:superfamily II DNA or RNA helicase|nr:DEAD/DEAH box helicase [Thermoanaerobaculaceae bacterium]
MGAERASASSYLLTLTSGDILGSLSRRDAELAFGMVNGREVAEVSWSGQAVEGTSLHPLARVLVEAPAPRTLKASCSRCEDEGSELCVHAAAVLFQWVKLRPSLVAKGAGTTWRERALQPFLVPTREGVHEVDLTHVQYLDELEMALKFQLSQHRGGPIGAVLHEERLQFHIALKSGQARLVLVAKAAVPYLLGELHKLGDIVPQGELATLKLSTGRAQAVLRASLHGDDEVLLEPGLVAPGATFVPLDELPARSFGRFFRHGDVLLPTPEVPPTLLPYFQRGRNLLRQHAALNFIMHDHFLHKNERWYEPQGELATTPRPLQPTLCGVEVDEDDKGQVLLRPQYRTADGELRWSEVRELLRHRFVRRGRALVRTPDAGALLAAGLKLKGKGLSGDRLALVRALAELRVPTTVRRASLQVVVDALLTPLPPIPDPPGLRSQLRPYQRQGTAWLWRLYRTGLGALLADDMGLGKTHQAMALLCLIRAEKPSAHHLVVCPRGVLDHWRHLLATFAPELPVVVYHGAQRRLDDLPPGAVVLTTYEIALRSLPELRQPAWEVVVFDEAQRAKNPHTKGSRAVRTLPAAFRVALTGTPIENRLGELWSIMDLVVPGYLGSERAFRSAYKSPSSSDLLRLRKLVAPFTLRRVKEAVLADLPAKHEELAYCRLSPRQSELYARIHATGAPPLVERLREEGAEIPYMHIFALLTRLKQVCDHPGLVDPRLRHLVPGKLELLDEILDEALAADNRVVVFSQYVQMIELLATHLQRREVPHVVMTGKTRDRASIVQRFNAARHEPVLLASLLATGVGIDLTAASVVVHYDRWWNPARENQATDRVHRIGQSRYVQVFKLITEGTIEERIDAIILRKLDLAREVVAPSEDVLRRLTRDELTELLGLSTPTR